MSHPVYGVGTSALIYIGDAVSDRVDGVPIGTVAGITPRFVVLAIRTHDNQLYHPDDLCLVRRADPNPKEPTT